MIKNKALLASFLVFLISLFLMLAVDPEQQIALTVYVAIVTFPAGVLSVGIASFFANLFSLSGHDFLISVMYSTLVSVLSFLQWKYVFPYLWRKRNWLLVPTHRKKTQETNDKNPN